MFDWLFGQLDTLDLVVVTAVIGGAIYWFLRNKFKEGNSRYSPHAAPIQPTVKTSRDESFVARMKSEGRQVCFLHWRENSLFKVLIIYGSQTGTAEELSGRLAKDFFRYSQKALVVDPEEIDVEDLSRLPEIENILLVLCVATYGEGDPTDNAHALFDYIKETDTDFSAVKYAVFGLGNKTYEHFNEVGKIFDQRLEELGAERVYQLGLGDDDANLEEDFMRWREGFLPAVAQRFTWELNAEAESQRQYRLETIEDTTTVTLFKGEFGRLGAFEKQRPPYDQKNPYISTVAVNRELHGSDSDRSCRHIEFSIEGSRIRYEAGDHVAVFPTNDQELVDKLISLVGCDADAAFRLINTDEESSKRNPFPCPTTYRTALTHYVDICAPLKSHVVKALSEYCEDEAEKEKLRFLSTATEEGLKEYARYINKERRSIVDVLSEYPSCKPAADHLLELLPRLQARYYSIASSPKASPNHIAVTCVVTRYTIGNRDIKGVCTNYLLAKEPGSTAPIFVRKSQMRLPHRINTPVIMIGPGTGYAPFRGFIQERKAQKDEGKEVGPLILFFGCRHPEHDYIYQEELEAWKEDGVLTELHIAFSRLHDKKIYVQDRLWENREAMWEFMQSGAHFYVCGDARNMARDVQNAMLRIMKELGGKDEAEAAKFFKDMERQRRYQADVWS